MKNLSFILEANISWLFSSVLLIFLLSGGPQQVKAQHVDKHFEAFEWNLDLPDNPVSRRISRHFSFQGPDPVVLADIAGPGCIRRFWITGGNIGRDVILRIYFDDEPVPYVEAPLNDFFGAMHNLMKRSYRSDNT